jgi:hypothetical protein
MTREDQLIGQLERFLDEYEGVTPLPDSVRNAVRAELPNTKQIGSFRGPMRYLTMTLRIPTAARYVLVAAVIVVAVVLGSAVIGRPGDIGGGPSPSASPSPSSSVSAVTAPALTETFTSERYGFSISYPAGWVTRPATEPWTSGVPSFVSTDGDVIYDPDRDAGHLWLMIASQPHAGTSGEQWVDQQLTALSSAGICTAPREAVVIDGGQGGKCASSVAVVTTGDRGYMILLFVSPDAPRADAAYDQEYFSQILATLQLSPQDAVDSAR